MKSPRGLSERSFGSAAGEFSLLRFFFSGKRNEEPSRLERKLFFQKKSSQRLQIQKKDVPLHRN